jgi:hypothetical protein
MGTNYTAKAFAAFSILIFMTAPMSAQVPVPDPARPASSYNSPDAAGFIQHWLILEPIDANGLTDSAVQAAVNKDYSPGQFTVIP